jgi:hypothetical protein
LSSELKATKDRLIDQFNIIPKDNIKNITSGIGKLAY